MAAGMIKNKDELLERRGIELADGRELEAVPLRSAARRRVAVISATCEIRLGMRMRCCRAACREAVSSISYYFRRLVPRNRLLARS